jgi:four helix bundle protein
MPAKSARASAAPEPVDPTPKAVAETATPPAPAAPAAPPQYGYRGLKVWQRAMDLATAVFAVTRGLAADDEVLSAELRRTAIAIPAGIATGNSLYQRAEYVGHLSTAHGSVARLECLLQVADRLGTLPSQDTAPLLSLAADVGRMLRGLARALAPTREAEAADSAAD